MRLMPMCIYSVHTNIRHNCCMTGPSFLHAWFFLLPEKSDVEVVKFLWKWKHFEKRSWKRTRKHLTFWGARSGGSIYHKTWSREVEALWRKKLEVEATNFSLFVYAELRSWKWKQKIFYCFHIPAYFTDEILLRMSINSSPARNRRLCIFWKAQ